MPYVYIPEPSPIPRFDYGSAVPEYNPYSSRTRSRPPLPEDPLEFVKAWDRYTDMKETKQQRKQDEKKKKDEDKKKEDHRKKFDWKPLQPVLFWTCIPLGYIFITACIALSHALSEMVK